MRWDIERLFGSCLRQDFLADPRIARFRRQRNVLMLPSDQHRSIASQCRSHHLGVLFLAITDINGQVQLRGQRAQSLIRPLAWPFIAGIIVMFGDRVGGKQELRGDERRSLRPPGLREQRDQSAGTLSTKGHQMFLAVIARQSAKIVHPGILHAVVTARLLGVPNHHDLGRSHFLLSFRRCRFRNLTALRRFLNCSSWHHHLAGTENFLRKHEASK